MAISRDEVAHFARVAGFDLAEEELDQLTPQLDEILTTLARVQEVPAEGIPPTDDAWELMDGYRGGAGSGPPTGWAHTTEPGSAAQHQVGVQRIAED